jgi:hypothetical protein
MYAHLAPSELSKAAAATCMPEVEDGNGGEVVVEEVGVAGDEGLSPRPAHTHGPEISNPAFFQWRAPPDSNGRPADSKSDALSS